MRLKKYLLVTGIVIGAIGTLMGANQGSTIHASESNDIEVTEDAELSSLDMNTPDTIQVSYGKTFEAAEANCIAYQKSYSWVESEGMDPAPVEYAKFTLSTKCYVKISASYTTTSSYSFPEGDSTVNLYSNKGYSVSLGETGFAGGYGIDRPPIYVELNAGTYYLALHIKSQSSFPYNFTGYVNVCAVKASDAVSVKKSVSKNKNIVTLKILANGIGEVKEISYLSGKHTALSSWSDATELSRTSVKLKKNSWYTFRIKTSNFTIYKQYKVSGIDTTKPTVKGVKNNKRYKKKVTIKYYDKASGIKKATLNGKRIKSGKKVTRKGKYVLKVWDKAGNVRVIKFRIIK